MPESPSCGVARWIVPVLTVFATSGVIVVAALVPSIGDSDAAAIVLGSTLFFGGFALAVANLVQAVVMAVRARPGSLRSSVAPCCF